MTAAVTMAAVASAGFLCAYASGVCGGVTSGETAVLARRDAFQTIKDESEKPAWYITLESCIRRP